MSIQAMFLGSVSSGTVTAQAVNVSSIRLNSASASISFLTNGQQTSNRSGSTTINGNWVTPTTSANEWEIRANLAGGAPPDVGSLGVWFNFSTNRTWSISTGVGETQTSSLTFEFRKVGGGVPEFTIPGTVLYAEATGIFP